MNLQPGKSLPGGQLNDEAKNFFVAVQASEQESLPVKSFDLNDADSVIFVLLYINVPFGAKNCHLKCERNGKAGRVINRRLPFFIYCLSFVFSPEALFLLRKNAELPEQRRAVEIDALAGERSFVVEVEDRAGGKAELAICRGDALKIVRVFSAQH